MTRPQSIPLHKASRRSRHFTPGVGSGQDFTVPADREPHTDESWASRSARATRARENRSWRPGDLSNEQIVRDFSNGWDSLTEDERAELERERRMAA